MNKTQILIDGYYDENGDPYFEIFSRDGDFKIRLSPEGMRRLNKEIEVALAAIGRDRPDG